MATKGDTFVEAASDTDLDAHTPTGSNPGTGWTAEEVTDTGGRLRVVASTDRVTPFGTKANQRAWYTLQPNPSVAGYDVQATLVAVATASGAPAFLVARAVGGSGNCYSAGTYRAADAADKKIFKRVGGTATELASGDSGISAGDVLKLEVRDGTKKLFQNGVERLSTTDNAITAAGRAGLGVGNLWASNDNINSAWEFDDFSYVEASGQFQQSVADTLSTSETLVRQIVRATLGEALTPAEALIRETELATLAEDLAVAETLHAQLQPAIGESLTLGEALAPQAQKLLAEAIAATETLAWQVVRAQADALGVTEALSRETSRPLADSLAPTESLTASRAVLQAMGDTLTTTEGLTRLVSRAVAESLALEEALAVQKSVGQAVGDTLTLGEQLQRTVTRALGEAVDLTEAEQRQVRRAVVESTALAEALTAELVHHIQLAEDLVLGEDERRTVGKVVTEALGLSEARIVAVARQLGDLLVVSESLGAVLVSILARQLTKAVYLVAGDDRPAPLVAGGDLAAVLVAGDDRAAVLVGR